jgi:hypothetical protein
MVFNIYDAASGDYEINRRYRNEAKKYPDPLPKPH